MVQVILGRGYYVSIGELKSVDIHDMRSSSTLNSCATPIQPVYAPNEPNNEKEPNCFPPLCTQLYISLSPNNYSPIDSLCQCTYEVSGWMCQNFLQLNTDKTEVIAFGNKDEVLKVNASTGV